MQYDFIGDIHGHADELEALLKKLGYVQTNGAYRNSGHTAVFLGDYIDRGPDVRRAVNIVRSMCEAGSALALMGNHEFNALAFWTPEPGGGYLREHSISKILIHTATLRAYQHRDEEFRGVLDWFYALPLFLETETFRAEHACWNPALMRSLKTLGITRLGGVDMLHRSLDKSDALFAPVDELLKGPELPLPQGIAYDDSEGVHRTRVRLCWWKDPRGKTLREMALQPGVDFPEIPVPGYVQARDFYGENEKPVFFGHYWLEGKPLLFRDNVCCLDYSVASYKGNGILAAYRFDGEPRLDPRKFVY